MNPFQRVIALSTRQLDASASPLALVLLRFRWMPDRRAKRLQAIRTAPRAFTASRRRPCQRRVAASITWTASSVAAAHSRVAARRAPRWTELSSAQASRRRFDAPVPARGVASARSSGSPCRSIGWLWLLRHALFYRHPSLANGEFSTLRRRVRRRPSPVHHRSRAGWRATPSRSRRARARRACRSAWCALHASASRASSAACESRCPARDELADAPQRAASATTTRAIWLLSRLSEVRLVGLAARGDPRSAPATARSSSRARARGARRQRRRRARTRRLVIVRLALVAARDHRALRGIAIARTVARCATRSGGVVASRTR